MRKLLLTAAIFLLFNTGLVLAAPVYVDETAGYKIAMPEHILQITGKDFVSFATDSDKNNSKKLYLVLSLDQKEVTKLTGETFTTDQFKQKKADLQVLTRNKIDSDKIDYKLFKLETFKSGASYTGKLLPEGLAESNGLLAAGEANLKDFVLLNATLKPDKSESESSTIGKEEKDRTSQEKEPPQNVQLALTSANNRLYILLTSFPANLPAKTKEEHSLFTEKKETAAEKKAAQDYEQKNQDERNGFLKSFKAFAPEPRKIPYGFKDKISGVQVNLPESWFYAISQQKAEDSEISLNLAFPSSTLKNVEGQLFKLPVGSAAKAAEKVEISTADILPQDDSKTDKFFKEFEEALAVITYKSRQKTFAESLKNPNLTKITIMSIINAVLSRDKLKSDFNLSQYNPTVDVTSNNGYIKLEGPKGYKNKYNLTNLTKINFDADKVLIASYLTNGLIIKTPEVYQQLARISLNK